MLGLRAILIPLLGGALIGLSASLMLIFNGRVTGVSGILGGVVNAALDSLRGGTLRLRENLIAESWRWMFLWGLLSGGALIFWVGRPSLFVDGTEIGFTQTAIAGVLVGFGTLMGSGCTSGHGVCGISRLSLRSLVATVLFVLFGMITVRVSAWVAL